jgi:hypothetical protein
LGRRSEHERGETDRREGSGEVWRSRCCRAGLAGLRQATGGARRRSREQAHRATGKGKRKATGARSLDRVVAIVNGDLILESDVEAEERFAAFQPFSEAKPVSRGTS